MYRTMPASLSGAWRRLYVSGSVQHHFASSDLVLACNVYVSEGRDMRTIASLNAVCKGAPNTTLANLFVDDAYNRSNFTLLSRCPDSLANAAVTLSRAAVNAIDFSTHSASHPRLGVVDHISCHPLAPKPDVNMSIAAAMARHIAGALAEGGQPVPTYLYGQAHPCQVQLASIRRALGYFKASSEPSLRDLEWKGALPLMGPLPLPPDFGPSEAPSQIGVCCVGATHWIVNFNVLLGTEDMDAAREIARGVSERGGGLHGVQSMALRHVGGIEIACNLLQADKIGPPTVEYRIRQAAASLQIPVLRAYCTGKSVDELLNIAGERL